MTKSTTFQTVETATGGQYSGLYLWSDAKNWTNGIPVNGDSVDFGTSFITRVDDLQNLTSIASLTTSVSTTLEIPYNLTIGNVVNTGGSRTNFDVTGTLTDNSPTNTGSYFAGNFYSVGKTGKILVSATPTAEYEYETGGTFAFTHPAASNSTDILGIAGLGETLELPGTKVNNVSYTAATNNLTVTTDAGTYAFTNFHAPANFNYTTSYDAGLGLAAITFLPGTAPEQSTPQSSGPLKNQYVWSNPANWSNSIPQNGVSLTDTISSYDDIGFLYLTDFTFTTSSAYLYIVDSLTIEFLTISTNVSIYADYFTGLSLAPTLIIYNLTGTGGFVGANGYNAFTEILGNTDPGESYSAFNGGMLYLNYSFSASSTFTFLSSRGTLALAHPGSTISTAINGIGVDDVIELPGTTVTGVTFPLANEMIVTTNTGAFTFTNISFATDVRYYNFYLDSTTNLVALKFLGAPAQDLDGTGTSDVLWYNSSTHGVGYWAMTGASAHWSYLGVASSTVTTAGIGDFNGNGTSDILWLNPTNNLVGEWLMTNGTPTWQLIGQGSTTMNIAGIGDFTGNGTSDILWLNPTNNLVGEWLMNNGTPTWQLVGQGSTTMNIAGIGDFNGDGKSDILWENPANNLVGLWGMNGSQATWSLVGQGSTTMNIVGIGDFTGSGTDDVLWENPTNGTVGFWGMNNAQAISWNVVSTASTTYRIADVADYYGNGTDDILWRNPTSGDVGIWAMNNGQATWHDLGISSTSFNTVKA